MNKVKQAFEHGKTVIPFITCGDPSLDVTEQLVYAMEQAGADLIELGIPFSDPTAEGPIIQAANIRALRCGVTTDSIFNKIENIRKNTQIPLVLVTYANVVFSYGIEKFMQKAAALDVNGIILTDVPLEEKEEFNAACRQNGIVFISMIAPAADERIRHIANQANGFAYCTIKDMADNFIDAEAFVRTVKDTVDLPCAVVMEEADLKKAVELAKITDGVIIGSEIVKLCGQYGDGCVPYAASFVQDLKETINNL